MWKNSEFSIRSRRNGTHNDIVRLLYLPQIYNNLGKIMVISRKKRTKAQKYSQAFIQRPKQRPNWKKCELD